MPETVVDGLSVDNAETDMDSMRDVNLCRQTDTIVEILIDLTVEAAPVVYFKVLYDSLLTRLEL